MKMRRFTSFFSEVLYKTGRKIFAPSTKPKFMREIIAEEPFPSPVKRPRTEVYQEARRVQKPVQKVIVSKPATPVIENKAELYAAAVEKPLPQRKAVPKRTPAPQQETKRSVDTATKPVQNPEQNQKAKQFNAKESVIGPKDTAPTAKPNQDGQYELSPVVSSILHDELQQVMIKVWQELPDAPPTEAERLVVDKFRNEAGDDLQNAMGLSVTSRLLNVHNPLYVKLHFSGKPEAGRLQEFIREYKITAFKRIGGSLRDTFAARFDAVADFDRLCARDAVSCGSATVTITPCYKYLSCPPSLKAIYLANIAKTKTQPTTNSSPQKQTDIVKTEKIAESPEVKPVTKEVVKIVNAEPDKSEKTQVNATSKTVKTDANPKTEAQKTVAAKVAQEKPKPETATKEVTEVKKVTPKKENKNEVVKVNAQPDKSEKTQVNATSKTVKTDSNPKTEAQKTVAAKVVQEKPKPETATKEDTEVKIVTPKKENKNEVVKNDVDKIKNGKELEDVIDDMTVVDEMGGGDDDEEMTDQDILALMSGGIVLDECSGSEDEK